MKSVYAVDAVKLDDEEDVLIILDQTLLPGEKRYLHLTERRDIWEAIYQLKVRGAPAIGIAAAYGVYLCTKKASAADGKKLYEEFLKVKDYLAGSRPTAVNLFWALDRMDRRFQDVINSPVEEIIRALKEEADAIRTEDEEVCRKIGENGLELLDKGWGLLTHCNAGTLATARFGTATAPMYLGAEQGYGFKVYVDETRPLLQGARLTAWELMEAGIDVTLICDNMASIVMKQGRVQAVLVGCDRVAANGDSANKIGTSGLAVLARYYGIPFYIHAPLSTVDLSCPGGEDIVIEQRSPEEVTEKWYSKRMAPEKVRVYNPAFDVTDAELITAIVTEKGIARPPYTESLKAFF